MSSLTPLRRVDPLFPVVWTGGEEERTYPAQWAALRELPSLPGLGRAHAQGLLSDAALQAALRHRVSRLGMTSLPAELLRVIYELAGASFTGAHFCWHPSSTSAAQTQRLLPEGVVLKTVTVCLGGKMLMWSSLGEDSLVERRLLHHVAHHLGLSRRLLRHTSLNPVGWNAVRLYGVEPGMVSPLVKRRERPLDAVVTLWPPSPIKSQAAISLSLFESLLLPVADLRELLRAYASRVYPQVRYLELEGTRW